MTIGGTSRREPLPTQALDKRPAQRLRAHAHGAMTALPAVSAGGFAPVRQSGGASVPMRMPR